MPKTMDVEKKIQHLDEGVKRKLVTLLAGHQKLFELKKVDLDKVDPGIEIIIKEGAKPVQKRGKSFTPREIEFLNQEIRRLLTLNVISPSNSLYDSLPTCAKKTNGDLRFTVNLIQVNE